MHTMTFLDACWIVVGFILLLAVAAAIEEIIYDRRHQ
jgi:hypothetical protein